MFVHSHTEKDRASPQRSDLMDISRMQVYIKNSGQFSQPPQIYIVTGEDPNPATQPIPIQPLLPLDELEQVSQLHLKSEPVQEEAGVGRGVVLD